MGQFFNERIASANEGIVEKTRKIQDDHVQIRKQGIIDKLMIFFEKYLGLV